jgi:chromosome segregation ATPase
VQGKKNAPSAYSARFQADGKIFETAVLHCIMDEKAKVSFATDAARQASARRLEELKERLDPAFSNAATIDPMQFAQKQFEYMCNYRSSKHSPEQIQMFQGQLLVAARGVVQNELHLTQAAKKVQDWAELIDKISRLESENNENCVAIEQLTEANSTSEAQMLVLAEEAEEVGMQLQESQRTSAGYRLELTAVTNELALVLTDTAQEQENRDADLSNIMSMYQDQMEVIVGLRGNNSLLQMEVDRLHNENRELRRSSDKMRASVDASEIAVVLLQEELRAAVERKTKTVEVLEKRIEALTSNLAEAREEKIEESRLLEAQRTANASIQERFTQLSEDQSRTEAERDEIAKRYAEQTAENTSLRDLMNDSKREHVLQTERYDKGSRSQSQKLEKLDEANRKLQESKQDLAQRLADQKRVTTELAQRKTVDDVNARKTIDQLEQVNARLEEEMRYRMEGLHKSLSSAERQRDGSQDQLNNVRANLEIKRRATNELQNDAKRQKSTISTLSQQLEDLRSHIRTEQRAAKTDTMLLLSKMSNVLEITEWMITTLIQISQSKTERMERQRRLYKEALSVCLSVVDSLP